MSDFGKNENIDKIFSRCEIIEDRGTKVDKLIVPNWRMSDRNWVCKILGQFPIGIART